MYVIILAPKRECGIVCNTDNKEICDEIAKFSFMIDNIVIDVVDEDLGMPIYGRVEFHTNIRWVIKFDPNRVSVKNAMCFLAYLWDDEYMKIYDMMMDVLDKPPVVHYKIYIDKDKTIRECEVGI